jgi:DNA-directed RNA polymerase subunit RPC12/RpoP
MEKEVIGFTCDDTGEGIYFSFTCVECGQFEKDDWYTTIYSDTTDGWVCSTCGKESGN